MKVMMILLWVSSMFIGGLSKPTWANPTASLLGTNKESLKHTRQLELQTKTHIQELKQQQQSEQSLSQKLSGQWQKQASYLEQLQEQLKQVTQEQAQAQKTLQKVESGTLSHFHQISQTIYSLFYQHRKSPHHAAPLYELLALQQAWQQQTTVYQQQQKHLDAMNRKKSLISAMLLKLESQQALLKAQQEQQDARIAVSQENQEAYQRYLQELQNMTSIFQIETQAQKNHLLLDAQFEKFPNMFEAPVTRHPPVQSNSPISTVKRAWGNWGNKTPGRFLKVTQGASIHAVAPGKVVYAQAMGAYGNTIIIHHGHQNFSIYGQLPNMLVQSGHFVVGGQHLASISDASEVGKYIYFELRRHGKSVIPDSWIQSTPPLL